MAQYPRPDFQRPNLTWTSLNGPWYFLFDDTDIGLSQDWHINGLPSETSFDASTAATNSEAFSKESDALRAAIAANPDHLIKDNVFKSSGTGTITHQKREIQVPYVWQSPASVVEERGVHEVFWYEKEIRDLRTDEQKHRGDRVLLRFGAVDYEARVWVGGHFVGSHSGGHVPFEIDVTDELRDGEAQKLLMRVYDSAYDLTQPGGKQYWGAQPESIFYTPSGGIWLSVWMEVVPRARIGDSSSGTVLRSDDIEEGRLKASIRVIGRQAGWNYSVEMEVRLCDVLVSSTGKVALPRETDLVCLEANMRLTAEQISRISSSASSILETAPLSDPTCWLSNTALWSPSHPTLYTLHLKLYDTSSPPLPIDSINTYTGMRQISLGNSAFHLNNAPFFQALLLDQGYWPQTFMTPPSPSALETDILLAKKMGFNGVRKHQKVEDPLFAYYADHLGFLVWSEMPNAYAFSAQYAQRFDQEWHEAVARDINHPSVVVWTPVNESWAYTNLGESVEQRQHIRSLYHATKVMDPSRPINDNCGWEHVVTDLATFHDYADAEALEKTCSSVQSIMGPKAGGRPMFLEALAGDSGSRYFDGMPIICTEFGGVNIRKESNAGVGKDWGYTTASNGEDLLKRIENMMEAIVKGGHVCGFVYTQLTDIEQEVNGLYTAERKEKLDAGKVKQAVERIMKKYYDSLVTN